MIGHFLIYSNDYELIVKVKNSASKQGNFSRTLNSNFDWLSKLYRLLSIVLEGLAKIQ